jgi:mevalonate pyrophosphate decarboxylase|tara:strand:- start:81 stop:536 length:456 start_codon:yes stop_codon:yes gene_type:complete
MCDILELSMLLKKIPCDVIREHIIPYTFQVQPKELCDDISSYHTIKSHIKKLYYDRWKDTFHYEENADINWLSNDLRRFLNDDVATMYGYTNNCLEKWRRLFYFQDKSDYVIMEFISNIHARLVTTDINLQLATLTENERQEFIIFSMNLD